MFTRLNEVMDLNSFVQVASKGRIVAFQFLIAFHALSHIPNCRTFVRVAIRVFGFVVEKKHVVPKRPLRGFEHAASQCSCCIPGLPEHTRKFYPRR